MDAKPSHVSRFATLPPRMRPAATCPECGRRLTLKLGRVLRHHAAHEAHQICAATRPETALHLDLKFHIAARLEDAMTAALPLVVIRRCAGVGRHSDPCGATLEREWLHQWDGVVVEARTGAIAGARPDIMLLRAGTPVAAVEVLVSHAVSDVKAATLAAAGVPWIEVRASHELLEGDAAWRPDHPLPVERARLGVDVAEADDDGAWRCARHRDAHRAWSADIASRRAAEEDAERRRSILRAARVVDFYHRGGARDREIYRVEEQWFDGEMHALTLRRGAREVASEPARDSADSKRAAWTKLRAAYSADVAERAASGALTDSPMKWTSGDAAENLVSDALYDMVPGDPTPLATRYPRRWYYARDKDAWFLPRDMRPVRWDRPTGDVFAAHPAWTASRAVVRERPAPEGAWPAFVFAARPDVSSFGSGTVVARRDGALTVLEIEGSGQEAPRALVVLTSAAAEEDVRRVAKALDAGGVQHLWLSHPMDWSRARADLAWAPAGRDNRGRGVVVVDDVGVYRAAQFARAFARGERRLAPEALRRRMASRVSGLRA